RKKPLRTTPSQYHQQKEYRHGGHSDRHPHDQRSGVRYRLGGFYQRLDFSDQLGWFNGRGEVGVRAYLAAPEDVGIGAFGRQ
ncbi:MAG: hypothetical protein ACI9WU_003811, partial [Myxococcota bacterium]